MSSFHLAQGCGREKVDKASTMFRRFSKHPGQLGSDKNDKWNDMMKKLYHHVKDLKQMIN